MPKAEEVPKEVSGGKPARLPSTGKNLKVKSKVLPQDSDDSDERDDERKAAKSAKKPHSSGKKAESKEIKSEPTLQPLHVDVGTPAPTIQDQTLAPEEKHYLEGVKEESETKPEIEDDVPADSAIDPDIVKSTDSFLLVKSSDTRELDLGQSAPENDSQEQTIQGTCSNSTSTSTVDDNKTVEPTIPPRRKSSDLDVKSESENTDEQTSVKSDSDFVVINEHTASEQSSVYLYDTRESPENVSPKHYSSSSNGKRSPTDSDFSIISEGRFHDMHDSIHAGPQGQDVGNIVEQASMALIHRVSPSYSADIESEDQDDKATPSSGTDEHPRSNSEEEAVVREEQNSTPTPREKGEQDLETSQNDKLEKETPRPSSEDVLKGKLLMLIFLLIES